MPLNAAIRNGNLDKLQEILGIRDNNGIPLINVNSSSYDSVLHNIIFTEHPPELKRLMIQTILDLRDNANNLIVDLNIFYPHVGTVLTVAIDNNDLVLIQQILDVRNHDGSLRADLWGDVTPAHAKSPLTRALFLNRLEIVQFLIDARDEDGRPFYLVAEIQAALTRVGIITNESTTWLAERLQEAGIIPMLLQNPWLQIAPIATIEDIADRQNTNAFRNNAFYADRQNTHATEVTVSTGCSIKKLLNRYKIEQNKISDILLDCENYILSCASSQKKRL